MNGLVFQCFGGSFAAPGQVLGGRSCNISYGYFLSNYLVACNLHETIMSLLCKFLDAGFIGLN